MSAPLVWIFFPGVASILLYIFRHWERLIHFFGILIVVILTLLAWQMPIDQPVVLGIPGVPPLLLQESFPIFGQEFLITAKSQPALVFIYLAISMWFGGALIAGVDRLFIPAGLAIAALLTASITIQPPTFSILLVEMVALFCVPILSPPGKRYPRGILRFLIFQTLGMMIILLADWNLGFSFLAIENPSSPGIGLALLGLGFALIMGIFPFHSWIPMIAEETHPYAAAFVFFIYPTSLFFLLLNYLNTYSLSSSAQLIYSMVSYGGLVMTLVGGLWALFERNLSRILGFSVIAEIGIGLLAISLTGMVPRGSAVTGIFFALLFPQLVSFAVWALALSIIASKVPDLSYRSVRGIAYQYPIATAGLVFASFSLAGAPFLASFPSFFALWSELVSIIPTVAGMALLGVVLLFTSYLRVAAVLVMSPEPTQWQISENGLKPVLLVLGTIAIIVLGNAPQFYMELLTNLASIFISTGP